ncbi:hypothetical protein [Pseudemcibacter aquimaris]|nr:hypothetical protein [Pseudemcibacter aquimaris]
MNKEIKGVLLTAAAVLVAGLILKYGEDLPLIKDAKDGLGG